jgi:HD-GYP domain-containing protein (c-di-GMP phosphodiesterase class II)
VGWRYSLADQARALALVFREEFGVPFTYYDAVRGELVRDREPQEPRHPAAELTVATVRRLAAGERPNVTPLGGCYLLTLPIYEADQPILIAVGVLGAMARAEPDLAQEQFRIQKWLRSFGDRLRLSNQCLRRHRHAAPEEGQAAVAWEAILTLDRLARRLRTHKQPARNQKRILESALRVLGVQALAWVPAPTGAAPIVVGEAGFSAWDCRQLALHLAREPETRKAGLALCNDVSAASWGACYPQLATVLALPVGEDGPGGWVLALNKQGQGSAAPRGRDAEAAPAPGPAPFRRSDAAALTPFVALLDLQLRSFGRYDELKQLLVGLTRSLTAAIDAKDAYTFGHSERVARIAVELGTDLGLQEEELSDLYLAGLLHDIGKIGVRDAILAKREPLTAEELAHIKEHVIIGYKILADLRLIRNLLPGVLHHHERYDGSGYPDGLAGENIPLLARILAVADAYDAMSTARPYRSAMPAARVEQVLLQGAGSQWDRRVVEALVRCRERILAIRQRGVGESLSHALDGALRTGDSSIPGSSLFN